MPTHSGHGHARRAQPDDRLGTTPTARRRSTAGGGASSREAVARRCGSRPATFGRCRFAVTRCCMTWRWTMRGPFRTLYVFPTETLAEVQNATVHAFLATALVPRDGGYTLYWAIYVRSDRLATRLYMALIDPFRRRIVYPAIVRSIHAAWV